MLILPNDTLTQLDAQIEVSHKSPMSLLPFFGMAQVDRCTASGGHDDDYAACENSRRYGIVNLSDFCAAWMSDILVQNGFLSK